MQTVLALVLLILVALMLLLPPLAFLRAVARYYRISNVAISTVARAFLTLAATLPLLVNLGYMALAWRELAAGHFEPDQNMAVAVLISWLSFWGRVALGRRFQHRRDRARST